MKTLLVLFAASLSFSAHAATCGKITEVTTGHLTGGNMTSGLRAETAVTIVNSSGTMKFFFEDVGQVAASATAAMINPDNICVSASLGNLGDRYDCGDIHEALKKACNANHLIIWHK